MVLARRGEPVLGRSEFVLGGLHRRFRFGQPVGRLAPFGLGIGKGGQQLAAPFGKPGRQAGQPGKLVAGLGGPLFQGLGLGLGSRRTFAPLLALGGDRLQPLGAAARLALETVMAGSLFGIIGPVAVDACLELAQLFGERGGIGQALEVGLKALLAAPGLTQLFFDAAHRLVHGAHLAQPFAHGLFVFRQRLAGRLDGGGRLAPCLAGLALGEAGLLVSGPGGLEGGFQAIGAPLRLDAFGLQRPQPITLRQPLGGRRWRLGSGAITVPAPQIALAADQPLTRRKQALQALAVSARNEAGMAEPPLQRGGRGNKAR